MRVSVHTNMKLFQTGMIQLIGKVESGTVEAMWEAMEAFRSDCLNVSPACPTEFGDLKAAHHIEVQPTATGVRGVLTVNARQAASLHEGISRWGTPYRKWTTPGTGSHWISSKALVYRMKYLQKIAEVLRRTISVKGYFRKMPFGLGVPTWIKPFTRMIKAKLRK